MKKQIFILVLSLCMLCALPFAAYAETCAGGTGCTHVAAVGSEHYASIQNAVEAVVSEGNIVVLKDHEIDCDSDNQVKNSGDYATLVNVAGKTVTIDLNGKTIIVSPAAAQFTEAKSTMLMAVFAVDTNGTLTLKDSSGGSGLVEVTANDATVYSLACCYGEGGKLYIESGSYKQDVGGNGRGMIYSQYNEVVTVNGGNFHLGNVGTLDNGSPWIFNASGQNIQHLFVNGGTFNDDILHGHYPFEVAAPREKALLKNTDGINTTYTMVDAVAFVNEQHKSGSWYTNEIGYATLEEAIAAANKYADNAASAGQTNTITLLQDCTINEPATITADVTITGDFTITGNTGADPMLTIDKGTNPDATLTITGGVYEGEISAGNGEIVVQPAADSVLGFVQDMTSCFPSGSALFTIDFYIDNAFYMNEVLNSGDAGTKPEAPSNQGYTLSDWYKDADCTDGNQWNFADVIESDLSLYAKWIPNPDTPYQVEHWQQNIAQNGYNKVYTQTKFGTTDTETSAASRPYEGFTVQEFTQVNIVPAGNAVVQIYYDRNSYQVTYTDGVDGEEVFADLSETVVFGDDIPFYAGTPSRTGYIFDSWENMQITMPAMNITITAKWLEKADVTIAEAAQTYTWNGSAKSFVISGIPTNSFIIEYYVNNVWTTDAPSVVGSYDVKLTRAEDSTYKAYEKTINNGLVINAAVAKVGSEHYATIDEAIANWTNNTVLTLLADVTLTDVITLKSTEHHILNLGTYTMTAASGKNAIVIKACGTGSAERSAITINADATNPGGINAGSKCVVYYKYADGGISAEDRPIIKINGGVFTGSTSSWGTAGIYFKGGNAARKAATLNISGGTFNCSINGQGKSKLIISGGTFHYSVDSQGDSTASRLISGGTFKTFGFMTSGSSKFWIGTSMGNSNVGVHIDDNGYIVIGGPVITEPGDTYAASSANYSGASYLLQYSSAKDNQLYYTSVEEALADNNKASGSVTIYNTDELDLSSLNYKGTLILPENEEDLVITFNEGTTPLWKVESQEDGTELFYKEAVSGGEVSRTYKHVEITMPAAKSGLVYNAAAHELVSDAAVTSTGYTAEYALGTLTEVTGTWSTELPEAVDAGTYYVWFRLAATDGIYVHNSVKYLDSAIAKSDSLVNTDPVVVSGLVYSGDAQALVNAGTAAGGTMAYSLTESGVYAAGIPTATDAGDYTVYYKVIGDSNHNDSAVGSVDITIAQKAVAEPAVVGSYTYTGSEQTVVLSGLESYMTIAGGNKGTNAGDYAALITLDANHKWDVGSDGSVEWSIGKADPVITAPTAKDLTYSGAAQDLVNAGSSTGGELQYSLDGIAYATDIPTAADADYYTVYYKVIGDSNYNDSAVGSVDITISQKAVAEPAVVGSYTYTGSEHTVELSGVESYMTVAGGNKGTNAADYAVLINLDANYKWDAVSDGRVEWSIGKADPVVTWPVGTAYVNDANVTLTGGSAAGVGSEVYAIGHFTLDTVDLTSAGTKTVTITFVSASSNYNSVEKADYTIAVSKRTIAAVAAQAAIENAVYGTEQDALDLPEVVSITTVDGNTLNNIPVEWSGYDKTNLAAQILTGSLKLDAVSAEVQQPAEALTAEIIVDLQELVAADFNYLPKEATYNSAAVKHEIAGELEGVSSIAYQYEGIEGTSYAASANAPTNAGKYQVTATFTMQAGYSAVAPKTTTLTISQKEAGLEWSVLNPDELVYSSTAKTLIAAASGIEDGDSCTVTAELVGDNVNAGTFSYKAVALSNANYKLPADVNSPTYTIIPKTVFVTADSFEVYEESAPIELTYKVEGFIGDDDFILLPVCSTDANLSIAGLYDIVPGGADAGSNYTFEYINGTLLVKVRSLVVFPAFDIKAAESIGGKINVSSQEAYQGENITVTVAPTNGYEFIRLTIIDNKGQEIAAVKLNEGKFTFKMPACDVEVKAEFADIIASCAEDSSCPMYKYRDLDMNAWYHDGIHFCIDNGLMVGTDTDIFEPNTAISRAMIVAMLWRLEGSPVVNYFMDFDDVESEKWYIEAVRWAASEKIVEGYGDGKFGPCDTISREQLAAILYRYEQRNGGGFKDLWMFRMDYVDLEDVSDWAYEAMCWMSMNSVITGEPGKILDPKGDATRAQAATVFYRFCRNVAE